MMREQPRISDELRVRNPFLDPLVTELIEDPDLYRRMFSESILVGETHQVYQPTNAILLGPQGSGKSMILNLMRYGILSNWLLQNKPLPPPIRHINPFLGISMNLTRAGFHAFGRRSFSRAMGHTETDRFLDVATAADFLNQFLFREFLVALKFMRSNEGLKLKSWLDLSLDKVSEVELASDIASWDCWFGYYNNCQSIDELINNCEKRLGIWRSFLAANIDIIPQEIWETKTEIGAPLHKMGNLLSKLSRHSTLPLYVVVDQYEVLPELNKTHGTDLQRLVNTLIKSRDPVVFFKLGARTYDWGSELRIWGSESRIEVQRDYVIVNLSDVLMRNENDKNWLFPRFAQDVVYKRIKEQGRYRFSLKKINTIFGPWKAEEESWKYYKKKKERRFKILDKLDESIVEKIKIVCGPDCSPLELRLAAAWAQECLQRNILPQDIVTQIDQKPLPWNKTWWNKERKGIALLQIASLANQRKLYYGWDTLKYLAGGNITAFLLMCNEIWDASTRLGYHPLKHLPLDYNIQTEGIVAASEKWRARDKNEKTGGTRRYEVLGRLGPAISNSIIRDFGISNPGHSGFSLKESELFASTDDDSPNTKVATFLKNAVSWAIFEERSHTSKNRESSSRRKYYFHPLLSPILNLPFKRVKEPFYTDINSVYSWIFDNTLPAFGPRNRNKTVTPPNIIGSQLQFKISRNK